MSGDVSMRIAPGWQADPLCNRQDRETTRLVCRFALCVCWELGGWCGSCFRPPGRSGGPDRVTPGRSVGYVDRDAAAVPKTPEKSVRRWKTTLAGAYKQTVSESCQTPPPVKGFPLRQRVSFFCAPPGTRAPSTTPSPASRQRVSFFCAPPGSPAASQRSCGLEACGRVAGWRDAVAAGKKSVFGVENSVDRGLCISTS